MKEMGKLLGVSKVTVSKQLRSFAQPGMILASGGDFRPVQTKFETQNCGEARWLLFFLPLTES